jgi:catechol 2,3-dioxygenase-like lactoylglutathione lyase family enzyme
MGWCKLAVQLVEDEPYISHGESEDYEMLSAQITTPLRLDHLAVWVSDMEATTTFLTDVVGLKRHPMVVEVSGDDPTCGGMEAVFIDGNGLWLEMILPTTPGPGMDMLNEFGDGAIVEVNFEAVDKDYIHIIDDMAAKGIQMLSMDGSPLVDGGRIDEGVRGNSESVETGQRIAYWPTDISGGTTIEIYEKFSADKTNLLNVREAQWADEHRDSTAPRIDRVGILVEDLEKVASFYTRTMGLTRHPEVFVLEANANNVGGMKIGFIKASHTENVWIQLIQPTSPGYAMDLLEEKGSGYPMEVSVEVDDLDAFCGQMQAKGITMVKFDGSALESGVKWDTVEPYGDRFCYFPLSVSRGFRIMMYQRGPRDTSILHRRDDTFVG